MKVSRKHQIVIPKEARKALAIEKEDELVIEVKDNKLVMKPKPKNYTKKMLGLHRDVWKGTDVEKYIKEERKRWKT